jgi:integrase
MTRPVNNMPIHTISGRRGLPPKPSPHWRAIYSGLRVGYLRRPQDTTGRWLARLALPNNDIRQSALGAADDPPTKADGTAVRSYGQAVVAAQAWAASVKANPDASVPRRSERRRASGAGGPTIEDALVAYATAKRQLGQTDRASETLTVLSRYTTRPFRALPVAALSVEALNTWLRQLADRPPAGTRDRTPGRLSQGRVDKLRNVLTAALHMAKVPEAIIRSGLSASAMPRREGPGTREAKAIPSPDEVRRLLIAMQAIDKDLALFAEVLALTGTRPSQLSRCRRDDLATATGLLMIPPSRKGSGGARKASRGVPFPIGRELADRVARQLDPHTGLLFHATRLVRDFTLTTPERLAAAGVGDAWREVGRIAWNNDRWVKRVRAAVHAAGLDPAITLYSLRHARIIRLLQNGMTLREVAALTDTSAVMIERSYSKHIAATDVTTLRLRRLLEAEADAEAGAFHRARPELVSSET